MTRGTGSEHRLRGQVLESGKTLEAFMTSWHVTPILMVSMIAIAAASPEPALPPCPASPNCVSSLATDSRFIAPLAFTGQPGAAMARLAELLKQRADTTITAADGATIRIEFRTFLGFVDDGLFVLDGPGRQIHWRSAARTGYWDLGKNRRRLEEIRQQFAP